MRLSLTQKGILLVGTPLLIQLIIIGMLAYMHEKAQIEVQRANHSREISETLSHIVKLMWDIGEIMHQTQNNAQGQPQYIQAKHDELECLDKLKLLMKGNPEQEALLKQVDYYGNKALYLIDTCPIPDGSAKVYRAIDRRRDAYKQVKRELRELVSDRLIPMATEQKEIANRSPEIQAQFAEDMRKVLWIVVVVDFVMAVGLWVVFSKGIIKRLDVMFDNSLRLASGKPLHRVMEGNDEIARIDQVFHNMAGVIVDAARKERAIVDNARDVICTLDAKGSFVAVGPAATQVFGYTPEELIGNKFINIVAPNEAQDTLNSLKILMEGRPEPPFEVRVVRKDGKLIDIEWSMQWSQAESTLFCIAHDITDRKEIERLRQEVVQMVSHDLRTPLATIRTFLEMLEAGLVGTLTERGEKLLKIANSNSDRMLTLVKDLLDIEKMEAGMLELQKSDVDLAELMETVTHSLHSAATNQGIVLECKPTKAHVFADSDRLSQVLVNLISNAIKFSPPSSTITIEAATLDDRVEISVIDRGRGIPAEAVKTIFDRFSQVRASDAKEKGGSGLGLAICKALVELHGGTIAVESVEGEGSKFSFRIAAYRQSETAQTPRADAAV